MQHLIRDEHFPYSEVLICTSGCVEELLRYCHNVVSYVNHTAS